MSSFYKLSIKEIIKETADAVSILFNVPDELKSYYQFVAGQYVNLKVTLDGKEIRRAPNMKLMIPSIVRSSDSFIPPIVAELLPKPFLLLQSTTGCPPPRPYGISKLNGRTIHYLSRLPSGRRQRFSNGRFLFSTVLFCLVS